MMMCLSNKRYKKETWYMYRIIWMKSIDSVMYHVQYFITQCTVFNHYREAVISNVWYKTNINLTVKMFVLLKCYCTFTSITEKSWDMIEIKYNTIFYTDSVPWNLFDLQQKMDITLCYYFYSIYKNDSLCKRFKKFQHVSLFTYQLFIKMTFCAKGSRDFIS